MEPGSGQPQHVREGAPTRRASAASSLSSYGVPGWGGQALEGSLASPGQQGQGASMDRRWQRLWSPPFPQMRLAPMNTGHLEKGAPFGPRGPACGQTLPDIVRCAGSQRGLQRGPAYRLRCLGDGPLPRGLRAIVGAHGTCHTPDGPVPRRSPIGDGVKECGRAAGWAAICSPGPRAPAGHGATGRPNPAPAAASLANSIIGLYFR